MVFHVLPKNNVLNSILNWPVVKVLMDLVYGSRIVVSYLPDVQVLLVKVMMFVN